MDKSEEYRQSLRKTLKDRRFAHKHYSEQDLANARKLRRQTLETEIQEHKQELQKNQPPSLLNKVVKRIFSGRRK